MTCRTWAPLPVVSLSLSLLSCLPVLAADCGGGSARVQPLPSLSAQRLTVTTLNAAGDVGGYSLLPGGSVSAAIVCQGELQQVGTLGGTTSQALGLNARGVAVGESSLADGYTTHAFRFRAGKMDDLGTLGGSYSTAVAVNDTGLIAGTSLLAGDGAIEAFLATDSGMKGLGSLGGGYSMATALNSRGSVAGESLTATYAYEGFIYRDGQMTSLGHLGGGFTTVADLNELDWVVGRSELPSGQSRAFVWACGTMFDLGTLGGTWSEATAVNDRGQIVGNSRNATGQMRAFLAQAGLMQDLGTLGGGFTQARALNNQGWVAGISQAPNGVNHAVLWRDGQVVDLNTLLPADSGWVLNAATHLNDAGRIAGWGTQNGQEQAFVLDLASRRNQPPVASGAFTAGAVCGEVLLNAENSQDPDGDALSYEWRFQGQVIGQESLLTLNLPPGTNEVVLVVADPCGDASETALLIAVTDTEAPQWLGLVASPSTLWPPNGKLVPIQLASSVSDVCDPALEVRIKGVTCNERLGARDVVMKDGELLLAAKRGGKAGDRVYVVELEARDQAGNASTSSVTVTVPHDRR